MKKSLFGKKNSKAMLPLILYVHLKATVNEIRIRFARHSGLIVVFLTCPQGLTEYLEKGKEIKQNLPGSGNFGIFFSLIFDCYS